MHRSLSNIDPQAKLAKNVVVEPFVTIEKNVEIGSGTWIGSNVTIMEGARIGENCEIFPGAVISAIPQDLKFDGEDSLAIIRQLLPTIVFPVAIVALFIVAHSLTIVLSPIIAKESSPSNFKSCGIAEITAPGKISQFSPILAPSIIVTFDPIHVPLPISTFFSIVTNGSTTTFLANFACGSIYERDLCINYFLAIWARRSASTTISPFTKPFPCMWQSPLLIGEIRFSLNTITSPGVTFFLNLALSIFMKNVK